MCEQIQQDSLSGTKITLANKAWERLEMIQNGQIPYIPDDYFLLVDTLKRYYEGYLEWKIDTDPSCPIKRAYIYEIRRNFLRGLFRTINDSYVCLYPPGTSNAEKVSIDIFLANMCSEYTSRHYDKQVSFPDFQKSFVFVKNQRDALMGDMERSKRAECKNDRTEDNYEYDE